MVKYFFRRLIYDQSGIARLEKRKAMNFYYDYHNQTLDSQLYKNDFLRPTFDLEDIIFKLKHVQAIFYIWMIGNAVAALVFLFEKIKRNKNFENIFKRNR